MRGCRRRHKHKASEDKLQRRRRWNSCTAQHTIECIDMYYATGRLGWTVIEQPNMQHAACCKPTLSGISSCALVTVGHVLMEGMHGCGSTLTGKTQAQYCMCCSAAAACCHFSPAPAAASQACRWVTPAAAATSPPACTQHTTAGAGRCLNLPVLVLRMIRHHQPARRNTACRH